MVCLELEEDEEVMRSKGDQKRLAKVASQISNFVALVLRLSENQVSATIYEVQWQGNRCKVIVTLSTDEKDDGGADSLAMALVRQGTSSKSDLKILLPALCSAKLQERCVVL